MVNLNKRMSILYGLKLIKDQWGPLAIAIATSFLILSLDYLLTTGMPKVISGLNLVLADGNLFSLPKEVIVLTILIISEILFSLLFPILVTFPKKILLSKILKYASAKSSTYV